MEYRHVHYWQYTPGADEEVILDEAVVLSKKPRHHATLSELALFIQLHTSASYILIGRLSDDSEHIHTLVFMNKGEEMDNITYCLEGTPCHSSISQRFCYYPFDVAKAYPNDKDLTELNIESYLGSILLSENQEPLGLIALMDENKIEKAAFAEHLILILSPVIEEEIKMLRL